MSHKTHKVVKEDFSKPWQIKEFGKKDHFYSRCGICKFWSNRRKYNRNAYKNNLEYVYTLKVWRNNIP